MEIWTFEVFKGNKWSKPVHWLVGFLVDYLMILPVSDYAALDDRMINEYGTTG
jgi:hypothetical protein